MKSALGFVAILFAAVLVADARRYTRDDNSVSGQQSSSSEQSSGEKSPLEEAFAQLRKDAEKLKEAWESESQDIIGQVDRIKNTLIATKGKLVEKETDLQNLKKVLTKEECEVMGGLFMLKEILPKKNEGFGEIFSIKDCVKRVDFEELEDGDFKEARWRLLTQISVCDVEAFGEINKLLNPVNSMEGFELYLQIHLLGDIINQLTDAAGLTAGALYLNPDNYDTKDKFETMMEGASANAVFAIEQMQKAGICQPEPETNQAPARKRFQHARNLRAKLRLRHSY